MSKGSEGRFPGSAAYMAFISTTRRREDAGTAPARVATGGLAVAHVVNSTLWGGMEARTLETARWQSAHGRPSVIVTPRSGVLFKEAQKRGVAVEALDFAAPDKLANLRRMRSVFRDHGVGVADFHTNRSLALGVRDLATLVRSHHILRAPRGGRKLNREFPFDGFILSCEAGRSALVERGYARSDRVSVVGEWAEDRFYASHPTPAELRVMKRRLGLPAEGLVIGAVGMLRPDNAFDDLIRATARLHLRGLPVTCLIVGGSARAGVGPCEEELRLRSLAHSCGVEEAVRFLGQRTDVPDLLSLMDVATIVSRHTAQTRVAPEAAARGRPVVAFDVGALRETVEHGRTGLLTAPGDVGAFASALERLLTSPLDRAALGAASYARALSSFQQRGKMDETLAIYRQAMLRRSIRAAKAAPEVRPTLLLQAA